MKDFDPRDFDCCAYRSKSGKTGCGALRYYHDEPHMKKRHKFVEPERKLSDEEKIKEMKFLLRECLPYVLSAAEASRMMDGFEPKEHKEDKIVGRIFDAIDDQALRDAMATKWTVGSQSQGEE